MSSTRPEPDLDAEREVDLGRYLDALVARWWLPLLGLVVGVALGYLLAVGGKEVYRAQATVYVGTPYGPGGNATLQSLATNPNSVGRIARGQETIEQVSQESGMSPRELRAGVSTRAIRSGAPRTAPNQLYAVSVQGDRRGEVNAATAAIAERIVDEVGGYARLKRQTFRDQLASDNRQLEAIDRVVSQAQSNFERASPADRLPLATLLLTAEQRARCSRGEPAPDPAAARARRADRASPGHRPRLGDEDDGAKHAQLGGRCRPDRPHRRPPRRPVLGADRGARRAQLVLEGKRVAVVVPAFDEERLIGTTLSGIPDFVDRIIVVDDASRDGTADAARATDDERVEVVIHERNEGVGAAILTGYRRALDDGIDVTCVMAGDNQMDPADLEAIAGPVARGEVDYAKANRLFTGRAWELIPRTRYLGNAVLSLLTKIASGYWHVADSQSGYTAINRGTLELLDLDRVYRRYGFPNDMLVHLNVINARVRDIPSRPVYGVGESSGIRLRRVIPSISWLLTKAFFWRMREKYVIRDFHPLVFFYVFGILFSLIGLVLGATVTILRILGNELTVATVVLVALLLIAGLLFTLFAMLFDMESNRELR